METIIWIIMAFAAFMLWKRLSKDFGNSSLFSLNSTIKRGTKSERDLVSKLIRLGYSTSEVFHDLYLETQKGASTQIDLVIVANEGIIVIEVKDYKGWIYGSGNNTNWTQVLAYGKTKYKFFNPMKQNEGHIRKLQSQLPQFRNIPFYSLIVFYGECELKEINYVPEGTFIVKQHRIKEVLKDIKKFNSPAPYTNKEEITQFLEEAVVAGGDKNNQEKHVENIKNLVGTHRVYK